MFDLTRRATLAGAAILVPLATAHAGQGPFAEIEKRSGGRIGVAARDTGGGRTLFWREHERFIMCSSFKLMLVAMVLTRIDSGAEQADRIVRYGREDLLAVSPETTRNLATGMRIVDLCRAAVIYSDNTAANLLHASIGGPTRLTRWIRGLGDSVTRFDRIEPALNLPDGDKDTTTPFAMLGTVKTVLLGNVLAGDTRERLLSWMAGNTTGGAMLRAGLPKDWSVGDKTGRYEQDAHNAAIDLAIATPPGRAPILVCAYSMNTSGGANERQAVIADIGRTVTSAFS